MKPLNIRSKSMLGTSHSWAVTMRNLLSAFYSMNHDLFLNSINGYDLLPEEWSKFKDRECLTPDIDICYTLPRNFAFRYSANSKLKLAIYNYESSHLPAAWHDSIKHIDYALPSSQFTKDVFVRSGWPSEKCIVIPHGVNLDDFKNKSKVSNIKTNKKFKFLNISIPHYRKNISTLVKAYYKAFSHKDNVCLVIKTSLKPPKYRFECNVTKEILNVQRLAENRKRPLPQLEILECMYDDIIPLYNSCDCIVSASSGEGFGLPLLEGLAAEKLVIAPASSGQMDFLNKKNSLLVKCDSINADSRYQYWRPTNGATVFAPRVDHLAQQMRSAYDNYYELVDRLKPNMIKTAEKFTWQNAADKILELL